MYTFSLYIETKFILVLNIFDSEDFQESLSIRRLSRKSSIRSLPRSLLPLNILLAQKTYSLLGPKFIL